METPRPMDRLLCGDVGYGKTEVALRAAFKAVMDGKQVAVLVPTTVLAQQHYDTFRQRLAAFPVTVEMLSRFRTPREQDQILYATGARAQVDIVIGTHRLISAGRAVQGPRPGDHRRGAALRRDAQGAPQEAAHRSGRADPDRHAHPAHAVHGPDRRARHLQPSTPRPRSACRSSPTLGRTTPRLVRQAILRELERGGQVFFVHNRVQTIRGDADAPGEAGPRSAHRHRPRADAGERAGGGDAPLHRRRSRHPALHLDHRVRAWTSPTPTR